MIRVLKTILAFMLGVGIGMFYCTPRHIWDYEEKDLMELDSLMAKDKSPRLALLVITQDGAYKLTKFDKNAFELQYRVVAK